MSNHDDRLIRLLNGELSDKEKESLIKEVEGSEILSKEWYIYQEVMEQFDQMPLDLPSTSLENNFHNFLDQEIREQSPFYRNRMLFARAASVLLLVAVGIWIGQLTSKNNVKGMYAAIESQKIIMQNLIESQNTSSRIQGINVSYQLDRIDEDVLQTLHHTLLNDPSDNVKLATVNALAEFSQEEAVKTVLLDALQKVSVPIVRINIIHTLVRIKDESAAKTFEELLEDEDLDDAVREELHKGLIKII